MNLILSIVLVAINNPIIYSDQNYCGLHWTKSFSSWTLFVALPCEIHIYLPNLDFELLVSYCHAVLKPDIIVVVYHDCMK